MLDKSRSDIYEYLYNLFYGTVTENVYSASEPQELEDTDRNDGFIVLHVGSIYDASEFDCQAYGEVRCYVEAYVPPITRGRLDIDKYREFEDAINAVIDNASATNGTDKYFIQKDSVISSETSEESNANNIFFVFIKSFIITIDKQ